jgi:hypothetical protein
LTVADTSADAFHEHRDSGRLGEQQRRLMLWFHQHGGAHTRAELSQATGLRLSSVCGRVNELVALGYLEEGARRPCRVTGRSAHVLAICWPKLPQQLNLLEASH